MAIKLLILNLNFDQLANSYDKICKGMTIIVYKKNNIEKNLFNRPNLQEHTPIDDEFYSNDNINTQNKKYSFEIINNKNINIKYDKNILSSVVTTNQTNNNKNSKNEFKKKIIIILTIIFSVIILSILSFLFIYFFIIKKKNNTNNITEANSTIKKDENDENSKIIKDCSDENCAICIGTKDSNTCIICKSN